MKIDFKDLEILRILAKEKSTAYSLAKFIFQKSNIRNLSDKSQAIKSRLRKLEKYQLVNKTKNNIKSYYKTNEENAIYLKDLKIPIKKKRMLWLPEVFVIKNKEKWNIYQF